MFDNNQPIPTHIKVDVKPITPKSSIYKALEKKGTDWSYAFYANSNNICYYMTELNEDDFPQPNNVADMSNMFSGCINLTTIPQIDTSNVTNMIGIFNLSNISSSDGMFYDCYSLKQVIIRSLGSNILNSNAFDKCYHLTGTVNATYNPNGDKDCYIYVPRDMVDTLKSATNWSTYSDQIRALEDYTVDGTTTGYLDETKI